MLAEQSGIARVGASGRVKAVEHPDHDIGDIESFGGGTVLAVGVSRAEVIKLK